MVSLVLVLGVCGVLRGVEWEWRLRTAGQVLKKKKNKRTPALDGGLGLLVRREGDEGEVLVRGHVRAGHHACVHVCVLVCVGGWFMVDVRTHAPDHQTKTTLQPTRPNPTNPNARTVVREALLQLLQGEARREPPDKDGRVGRVNFPRGSPPAAAAPAAPSALAPAPEEGPCVWGKCLRLGIWGLMSSR